MTRLMFRRSRKTAFTRGLSLALAIVFTLSFTGVVHAVAPDVAEVPAEQAAVTPPAPDVVAEPVPEEAKEPAPEPEKPAPDADKPAEEPAQAPDAESAPSPDGSGDKPNGDAVDKDKDKSKDKDDKEPPADPGGYYTVPGNPSGCDYKFDPPSSGSFAIEVDGITVNVTLNITQTDDGEVLSWTADQPVTKVIVKGGPAANVYEYSGAMSGSGLHAPLVPSNKWADISWIGFCFGEMEQDCSQVRVYKFNDLNGDGDQDEGEGPLSGFTFHLEDTGQSATTGADGWAVFEPVPYGNYVIHEAQRPGWEVTTGTLSLAVTLNEPVEEFEFGNRELADDTWTKTFCLSIEGQLAVVPSEFRVAFHINGVPRTEVLSAMGGGTYGASIEVEDGTVISDWVFYAVVDGEAVALNTAAGRETITEDTTNSFTFVPGTISGMKFIDADFDGAPAGDPDDTPGADWTVVIDGPGLGEGHAVMTDASGEYGLGGLLPGTYAVSEVGQAGFVQIHPHDAAFATLALGSMNAFIDFVNQPSAASVSVTKTADVTQAMVGDTIRWTIVVENTGSVPLTDVMISDPMLGIVNLSIGPLAPGQSTSSFYDWVVPAGTVGSVTNTVEVIGLPIVGPPIPDSDSETVCIVPGTIEKSFRFETAETLVPNPEDFEVHAVVDGQQFVVPLSSQGGGVWTSEAAALPYGSVVQSWEVHAIVDGEHWPVPVFQEDEDEVLVEDTLNVATYVPGSIVGVKAIDTDRDGDADEAPGAFLTGWNFSLNGDLATDVTDGSGSFSFTGLLPGTFTVAEVLTAEQDALWNLISPSEGTQVVNVAGGAQVVLDPFVNQPVEADIDVVKTVSPTTAVPGDTVVYTFTVTNTGPWELDPVTLTDPLLPAVALTPIPALSPGEWYSFQVAFTIPGDQPAGTITNTVTAVGVDVVGQEVSDTDDAALTVEPFAPFTPPAEGEPFAPFTEEEPFLPFTGAELLGLLFAAAAAAVTGGTLRRLAKR